MRNFVLLALVLGLAACRGGDDGGGDDNPKPDGQTTEDVKIQDIQNDSMPACDPADPATCVQLNVKGVVVTAIDSYGGKTGDFWVQEPDGGEYSGVHVYGAPLDQVAALSIGDVVDIAGAQKAEFALDSDTSGNKLTELEPFNGSMTVTKVSSGTPLEPKVLDALMIGQLTDYAARAAEWEKWEGVLVKVSNVAAFSDDECVGSACNDSTLRKFDVTGDVVVESGLAPMPDPAVKRGDCLGSVTGVVDYFFDYQILPRTTAEIVTGGTACPVENTAELCGDGIDNDGNGFKDCSDNSCITVEATCHPPALISDIQAGTVTGGMELQNVLVAGISFNKRSLWVQTDAQAAANEGILIRGDTDLSAFAVGTRVNIIGRAYEGNSGGGTETLTQIQPYEVTAASGTATPVPVADQSAATLMAAATGEPFESVLVELKNVKVTALGTAQDYIATLKQNGTMFKADDDIYRMRNDDLNACYSSIIGFWSYNVFIDDWVFLPRKGAGDGPDATIAADPNDCI